MDYNVNNRMDYNVNNNCMKTSMKKQYVDMKHSLHFTVRERTTFDVSGILQVKQT